MEWEGEIALLTSDDRRIGGRIEVSHCSTSQASWARAAF